MVQAQCPVVFTGVMLTIGLALGRYWLDVEPQDFALWFEAKATADPTVA